MSEEYAYFFKCFSHASRNELLRLLARHGELTVEALADESHITASTVSRHLNMLRMQGIVDVRTDPPSHYYSLNSQHIIRRLHEFAHFLGIDDDLGEANQG